MTVTKPKLNGTHLIHGDSIHSVSGAEVAPSISVTTSAFADPLFMERVSSLCSSSLQDSSQSS